MRIDANCPGCRQPLQVPEDYLGRQIACPSCKHIFRIGPAPSPPPLPPPPPQPNRSRRHEDEEDYRSRPRRSSYAEEEDNRHWRGRADTAHTLGLLSCILCWIPIIGLILGIISYSMASGDLGRMSEERSGDLNTRARFESAKGMGLVGLILSGVLFATCCVFNLSMAGLRR